MAVPQIYCKRILFYDSVPFDEISYYNMSYLTVQQYEQKTLLTDAVDISGIRYEQQKVLSGDVLELKKKTNPVTVKFANYENFFNVKTNNIKYLYVFWIFANGKLIFDGIARQDNIKYVEEPTSNSEIITVEIPPTLNHFLNYFKQVNCSMSEMETHFSVIPDLGISPIESFKWCELTTFMQKFFYNSPNFQAHNLTGEQWYVNREPFFKGLTSGIYEFATNGFRKISTDTQQLETKTGFFVKLCNAMGWDFSLTVNFSNEISALTIRNRYNEYGVAVPDSTVNSINYSTELSETTVEYISIKDGLVKGGSGYNTPNAIPVKIISTDRIFSNYGYFFATATDFGGGYTLTPHVLPNYYLVANTQSDGNVLDYGDVRYSDPGSWGSRYTTRKRIENKNILYIDAGENDLGTRINMQTKEITADINDLGESFYDVVFKGNYGSMLLYRPGGGGPLKSYDYYSRTDTFKNNFETLLYNQNFAVIEVTFHSLFDGYYTGNYSQLQLQSPDNFLNNTWNITGIEIDIKNEITKMMLKRAL